MTDNACCSGSRKPCKGVGGGDRDCSINFFFFPFLYFPIFVDEESEAWGGALICPKAGIKSFFFLMM